MATSYTSLLGFALPVQGELNGTWGTTVNNSITQLADDAIAGVATASVLASDWTLTTTGSGATNEARKAILIATGSPGVSRNIIAPNKSKAYIVINQSNANVVIKGTATTGVTVSSGSAALVAWNGSDFIDASPAIPSIQSSASQLIGSIAGTDTITGSLTPALTAYATGQTFRFISAGANTGAVTININGLGAKSITKLGATALAANDIPSGAVVEVVYAGTQFQLVGPAVAITAPQFDNDTSIATTAFVQRALGNFAGISAYAVNTVLTVNNIGKWVVPATNTGLTFTLPLANAVVAGTTITVFGNALGVTISRQGGSNLIVNGVSSVTSISIGAADTYQFISEGTNYWYVFGSTSSFTGTGSIVKADSPTFTGNPTAPTPTTGDNDTSIATTAFVNASCLGLGQTWQDVTTSRASSTTYTNTTGRPIAVVISGITNSSEQGVTGFTVSGLQIFMGNTSSQTVTTTFYSGAGPFIVPNGATYAATFIFTSTKKWSELR